MLCPQIQSSQKQCDALEAGFQTIRHATGHSDVGDIVKKFLTRAATYETLQGQAAMTRDRIDTLKRENGRLSAAVDDAAVAGGPTNTQRDTYMKVEEYERRMVEVRVCV